jgi:hypothetical protein
MDEETLQYPAKIAEKVKADKALNLSELAHASGWSRGTLAAMDLPLEAGKIAYSDFRRILRRRQNARERQKGFTALPDPVVSLHPGVTDLTPGVVDKFRAPKSRHAQPAASHARVEGRAHSIG